MGFSIAWIAIRGRDKNDVLNTAGFSDTGEPDECCDSPVCGCELPGGWYLLFLNDICHPLVEEKSLQRLSQARELVVCQVEEHVMMSVASGYRDRVKTWSVSHDAQNDIYDISASGDLPAEYAAIHDRLFAEQEQQGGRTAGVDYIFDVPTETAQSVCGYKHDLGIFDWGEPQFTILTAL